ncbi:MAG TPA: cell division ATP-binding protein FtsE [Acidobacteriota bacterium]|nr:cell division ATP-binding protein FtsE [Acidobacteriota bacterium]
MVRLYNVYKDYDRKNTALIDISLEIPRGEFVFLTGPSGAGKTTLLKLLFRAEMPTRGSIIVNGRNVVGIPDSKVPAMRRELGIVFQDFKLLRHKTVFENISFIPKIQGVPYWQRRTKTYEVLKQVGIAHKMREQPLSLSGGEQQRVAIARALINDPVLILADEPTGNLDPDLSFEIMSIFETVNRLQGTTVLVATHDRALIEAMGKPVVVLDSGRLVDSRGL